MNKSDSQVSWIRSSEISCGALIEAIYPSLSVCVSLVANSQFLALIVGTASY